MDSDEIDKRFLLDGWYAVMQRATVWRRAGGGCEPLLADTEASFVRTVRRRVLDACYRKIYLDPSTEAG
jgi:hypothetical protein